MTRRFVDVEKEMARSDERRAGIPNADKITRQAFDLSPDDQHLLAVKLAANVGYKLVPEESITDAEDRADILQRLDRLEAAMQELNPGWRS